MAGAVDDAKKKNIMAPLKRGKICENTVSTD